MASQGGKFSVSQYKGKKKCDRCGEKTARWNFTCSPQFFTLICGKICDSCKIKCEECTAKNKSIKSALDL